MWPESSYVNSVSLATKFTKFSTVPKRYQIFPKALFFGAPYMSIHYNKGQSNTRDYWFNCPC